MSLACLNVPKWAYWDLPRWLRILVAVVLAGYGAAVIAAAGTTPVRAGDIRLFGLLVGCMVASVETTRLIGEPRGVVRDMYMIWQLPATVLLPPLYSLLVPVPPMVWTQIRVRAIIAHRRAYTMAASGLTYWAASLAFHAAAPVTGLSPTAGSAGRVVLWTLLVTASGILHLLADGVLILTAVWGSGQETRIRQVIFNAEDRSNDVAGLSLGALAAFAVAHSTLTILYTLPLMMSLQRSLRHGQLMNDARIDAKTGLLNDSTWRLEAATWIARAARNRTPVAVGIIDIDHFKAVNDTYGHLTGDAVLTAAAAAIKARLRDYDVVGRIGGEEFAILLPNTSASEAITITERLRRQMPRIPIPSVGPSLPVPEGVTISIGIAAADRPESDLGMFLDLADTAMYAAKNAGRNCVYIIASGVDVVPRPAIPDRPVPAIPEGAVLAIPEGTMPAFPEGADGDRPGAGCA